MRVSSFDFHFRKIEFSSYRLAMGLEQFLVGINPFLTLHMTHLKDRLPTVIITNCRLLVNASSVSISLPLGEGFVSRQDFLSSKTC